jgi:hypothetical protein
MKARLHAALPPVRTGALRAWMALACLHAACTLPPATKERCDRPDDCLAGYQCIAQVCLRASIADSGPGPFPGDGAAPPHDGGLPLPDGGPPDGGPRDASPAGSNGSTGDGGPLSFRPDEAGGRP